MSHKSVAKNSVLFFIAQASAALLAFASSILIARKAGPYITGQYSYLVWIGSTAIAIFTLGVPNAITKFVAEYAERDKDAIARKIMGNLLIGTTGISGVAAAILCAITALHWLPTEAGTQYYYLIAVAVPFSIIQTVLVGALKGARRYALLMWTNVASSALTFILLVWILFHTASISNLVWYYLATAVIAFGLSGAAVVGRLHIRVGRLPSHIWHTLIPYIAIVSGIILLDQVVWDRSEVLFLGHYSRPQQVAFYSLAYTLTSNVMTLLPGSILGALLPHVAGLQGMQNTQTIQDSYHTATRYICLIVGALVGGGIALATPLIHILYGTGYADMIPVFQILVFTAGWAAIVGIASTILYGMTQQTFLLKVGLILSIVNICLDFLVIPHYGAIGAAVANGIAQFIGGVLTFYLLTRRVKLPFPSSIYVRTVLVTVASGFIILIISRAISNLNLVGFLGCCILFAALFVCLSVATGLANRSDLFLFRKILGRQSL